MEYWERNFAQLSNRRATPTPGQGGPSGRNRRRGGRLARDRRCGSDNFGESRSLRLPQPPL